MRKKRVFLKLRRLVALAVGLALLLTFGASAVAGSPIRYPLTVVTESGGAVSPTNSLYEKGRVVILTASADPGYVFAGWVGAGSGSYTGTDNPATVVINGPIKQTALFDLLPCKDADGDGFGSTPGPSCVSSTESDCKDADPTVYPGAPQLCDGVNNDCHNPTWPDVPSSELDDDGDGLSVCVGDCDDTVASCSVDCSDGNGNRIPDCRESAPPAPTRLIVR
jgi:hypothetical protein